MSKTGQKFRKSLKVTAAVVCLAAGQLSLVSVGAKAGSCPTDQITSNGQAPGPNAHKDVTDRVLTSIPLATEAPRLKDHQFRLRRLVVQPGGIVAWHNHAERPAIIYIISGRIYEYASTCKVPILHKAGEVATETHATSHWWKNTSNRPVVLLSADILHMKDDPKTM